MLNSVCERAHTHKHTNTPRQYSARNQTDLLIFRNVFYAFNRFNTG